MKTRLDGITGPSTVYRTIKRADGGRGVVDGSPETFRSAQEAYLARQREAGLTGAEPHEARPDVPLVAYVNDGRLLVDCSCGSGVVVDYDAKMALCFQCGARYAGRDLALPTVTEIRMWDEVLTSRPRSARNFHPGFERLEDARRENLVFRGGRR